MQKINKKNTFLCGLSRRQIGRGMAILEVLIAMLVVAVGLLPLVFLQVKADRAVMSAYTKTEHNAAALSIMDLVASDANKNAWAGIEDVSGDCASSTCGWRKEQIDNLLLQVLPNRGSGLVCINKQDLADKSLRFDVHLWWFSAGRGSSDRPSKSQTVPFNTGDCKNLSQFADKWNIDTVSVSRIF